MLHEAVPRSFEGFVVSHRDAQSGILLVHSAPLVFQIADSQLAQPQLEWLAVVGNRCRSFHRSNCRLLRTFSRCRYWCRNWSCNCNWLLLLWLARYRCSSRGGTDDSHCWFRDYGSWLHLRCRGDRSSHWRWCWGSSCNRG